MTTPRRGRTTPAHLTEEQRALYDRILGGPRAAGPQHFSLTSADGSLVGPFDALLLSPTVGAALQDLGAAVRYRTGLTDRVREMAILLVAAHWDSAFERSSHEAVGRAAGLTDDELAVLRTGGAPELPDADEAAAIEVVRALLARGDLDDDEYARATERIGDRAVFELSTLIGYYATLALQLRVFRADGEEEPG